MNHSAALQPQSWVHHLSVTEVIESYFVVSRDRGLSRSVCNFSGLELALKKKNKNMARDRHVS